MSMEHLQAQLAQLKEELTKLKKARRPAFVGGKVFSIVASFLLGGLILGPLWPGLVAQDKDKKEGDLRELTCSTLKVVSKTGQTLIVLSEDAEGGYIKINSPDGKQRTFIGVARSGGGMIKLCDHNEAYRTVWDVTEKDLPRLRMINADGKDEVWLGSAADGRGGLLNLNNSQGAAQIILDIHKDGMPILCLNNRDKRPEVIIGGAAARTGGVINLNAPNGDARLILDVDDRGEGRLSAYNNVNKLVLDAGSDAKGGRIAVSTHTEKDVLYVGTNDKSKAGEIVFSTAGKEALRLGVGEKSIGGIIDVRDADGRHAALSVGYFDLLQRRARSRD